MTQTRTMEQGVSAMGLTPHKIVNDYSQFNHHACRATYVGTDENGRQGFVELRRGRPSATSRNSFTFTFYANINQVNPRLRVGDRGDLYIIATQEISRLKFIADRKEARLLGE